MQAVLNTFFFQFFIAMDKKYFCDDSQKDLWIAYILKYKNFHACSIHKQRNIRTKYISQMIAWKCVEKGCGVKGQGNVLQIAKSG